MPIDALSVSCAQLTRDLLAIAKFLCLWLAALLRNSHLRRIAATKGVTRFPLREKISLVKYYPW